MLRTLTQYHGTKLSNGRDKIVPPIPATKPATKPDSKTNKKTRAKQLGKLANPNPPVETYYPTVQEQNQTPSAKNDLYFETFCTLYPTVKNIARVKCAWDSQGCGRNGMEIIAKLKEQIKHDAHFLDGFEPSASNYIMQERWKDEIKMKKKGIFDHADTSWAMKKDIFD